MEAKEVDALNKNGPEACASMKLRSWEGAAWIREEKMIEKMEKLVEDGGQGGWRSQ